MAIVNWILKNKLQWNYNENSNFSFKKMPLKMSSAKWWPFCPRGDELIGYNPPAGPDGQRFRITVMNVNSHEILVLIIWLLGGEVAWQVMKWNSGDFTVQCALDISRSYFFGDFMKDTPKLTKEGEIWGIVREWSLAEVVWLMTVTAVLCVLPCYRWPQYIESL